MSFPILPVQSSPHLLFVMSFSHCSHSSLSSFSDFSFSAFLLFSPFTVVLSFLSVVSFMWVDIRSTLIL